MAWKGVRCMPDHCVPGCLAYTVGLACGQVHTPPQPAISPRAWLGARGRPAHPATSRLTAATHTAMVELAMASSGSLAKLLTLITPAWKLGVSLAPAEGVKGC